MEVLSSRIHLAASDFDCSREFYEAVLGLRVYREYGTSGTVTGVVFFCGGGYLELGRAEASAASDPTGTGAFLWLQVPSLTSEHERLAALGVPIDVAPRRMPWGLDEMWLHDPDGFRIVVVEVPAEHPLRRRVD